MSCFCDTCGSTRCVLGMSTRAQPSSLPAPLSVWRATGCFVTSSVVALYDPFADAACAHCDPPASADGAATDGQDDPSASADGTGGLVRAHDPSADAQSCLSSGRCTRCGGYLGAPLHTMTNSWHSRQWTLVLPCWHICSRPSQAAPFDPAGPAVNRLSVRLAR